ncbi:MAG: hypothetical protein WAV16_04030 [Candidatus Moraniibacteriota bacterium]
MYDIAKYDVLIIGESQVVSEGEYFVIEPCVGGMASGIQMKWRIRYTDKDGKERVLVVMNKVLFTIFEKYYLIDHTGENYLIYLTI